MCIRDSKMTGLINLNVVYKSKEVISKLYNSYVRQVLEYCAQFWAPYLRKDIDMLERVQRRATGMISGFEGKNYEERLKELGMFSIDNTETNKFFIVDHG